MNGDRREDRLLGTLFQVISLTGIAIALASLLVLVLLGEPVQPWPLGPGAWWSASHPFLRAMTGAGLLVLFATPIAVHVVLAIRGLRRGERRPALIVAGVLVILAVAFLNAVWSV